LNQLANAKSVIAELIGKNVTIVGEFSKLYTFRAFKDFLDSSYQIESPKLINH
jgi:hypothetical protein